METRLRKLIQIMEANGLDAVALNPGSNLSYLTGLDFHLMERPVIVLFGADGKVSIVLPALEKGKLEALKYPIHSKTYGDDPAEWNQAFVDGFADFSGRPLRIGVEPNRMRILEESYLQQALPKAELVHAGSTLAVLRLHKDEKELAKMRQAAIIAQNALLATLRVIRPGWTEQQIAAELSIQLLRAGSQGEGFSSIVALSENAANPHSTPGQRTLSEGDFLLIDYGAIFEGYASDITRTFSYGEVSEEMQTVAGLVYEANCGARENGKPGMPAGTVDGFARSIIEAGGYGEFFTHRTGHGLGMEIHEAPYIFAGNPLLLEEGMTFTIEPGIYLPGRFGVRIEDDVVVTSEGLRSLTDLPRRVLPLESFWK
ncbi:MAG TPA: Xaa-Pro peptidase family protein [Anaerolineaceae bacterium]|nr:Xaa-Pro peptidase family protein [Anaerolineaceae bacterium]